MSQQRARENERRTDFVRQNEEDAKVFEHGALRHHLQMEHAPHRCSSQQTVSEAVDTPSEPRTSRVVPEPDPDALCAPDRDQRPTVGGR